METPLEKYYFEQQFEVLKLCSTMGDWGKCIWFPDITPNIC